jgi:hypothetical protein
MDQKKEYIDEGHINGTQYYTKEKALKVIKEILTDDKELLRGRDPLKMSDDDLFDVGYNFYRIYQNN